MELRQIQYFICLFEEGTVTKAAKRMSIVQPALSMQIAKLEEELGQKLFDRTAQGMRPTSEGRRMYQLFLPILQDLYRAREAMLKTEGELRGHINVGLITSIAQSILADVLREFSGRHPQVNVTVVDGYSTLLADWVASGQIEAAVINKPQSPLGLATEPMHDEALLLVTGPHFSRELPDEVPLDIVASQELVLLTRRHGLRSGIDSCAKAVGLVLQPGLETDSFNTIVKLVETTHFATILPLVAVQESLEARRVICRAIVAPQLTRQVVCVTHPRRSVSPACAAFLQILGQRLRARPGHLLV